MRLLCLLLIVASQAVAACPTSDGYTSTCFVATNGNDTTGTGTISAPFATGQKAVDTWTVGDTVIVRGGTYTPTSVPFAKWTTGTPGGASGNRNTIKSYPGEMVVLDCQGNSVRAFHFDPNSTAGHITISGMLVRNCLAGVISENLNDGITVSGMRFLNLSASGMLFGRRVSHDIKLFGVYLEANAPFDSTACTLGCAGNGDGDGVQGLTIQDSVLAGMGTSASDTLSSEGGNDFLFERVSVTRPASGQDCFDMKGATATLNRVTVGGCAAKGATVWGYSKYRNVLSLSGSAYVGGEWKRDQASGGGAVDGAIDDGGFIRITTIYAGSGGGMAPSNGQRIRIAGVLGCTGANGDFRIKDVANRDEFRIMNDDGSGTACGGAYQASASSTIRMLPPASGYYADIEYSTFSTAGGDPLRVTETMPADPVDGIEHPWRLRNSIIWNTSTTSGKGVCASSATANVRDSDHNAIRSERSGGLYHLSYTSSKACASGQGNLLNTFEPYSTAAAMNLDTTTYRATASTPVSTWHAGAGTWTGGYWNKGYYAGLNEVVGISSTAAVVKNLFPSASETVTATVSANTDFSSPVETLTLTAPGAWRYVVFGKETPLTPGTTYYYKLQQGYDVVTGSFTTPAAAAGNETLSVSVTAPTGLSVADAVLETSADGSSWSAESPVACVAACTLSASLAADAVYYYRYKLRDGAAAVLSTSQAQVASLR